ncbi:MAG: hypothetical protein ACFFCM_18480 [Promethearchaeota archaeon]
MAKETIYEGEMTGTVIGEQKVIVGTSKVINFFAIKLDEEILGVPNEFIVNIKDDFPYIRKDDKVKINGKLKKFESKDWKLPIYLFTAKKLYNLTLKFSLMSEI